MFHHVGIYVANMEESIQFYKTVLPIQQEEKWLWNDTELVFLKGKGFLIELIPERRTQIQNTHIAFSVKSVADKIQELKHYGIQPSEGPFHLENGWETVFYEGPDGEEIEFINALSHEDL
jgi:catechol 2,3-dioxygenase-like lactoylglutathione lyase family enzyme